MERLSDAAIEIINELHTERLDYYSEYIPLIDAANRLAAYEDLMERWKLMSIEEADRIFQRVNALGGTDLMAQYRAIGSIDHLRDLLQAEKDGRLVVLPCKAGSLIYVGRRPAIITRFFGYVLERYFHAVFCDENKGIDIPFEELGKTVFLTREEAEAALAKEGGTHEDTGGL